MDQTVFEGSTDNNVDILSNLTTDLICRIFSFLPTNYAVVSGILSKRWKKKNICAYLPVLDFDMDTFDKNHLTKFKDFVDKLLGIRLNVSTRKFSFICSDSFEIVKLYSWLKMATMSNLAELNLDLDLEVDRDQNIEAFPSSIFRYKTLVVLKLSGNFDLDLPSKVSLPNLKSLYLSGVAYVNGASLQLLLCGCPVLEDLNILPIDDDSALNYVISVPSLKRLTLIYFSYDEETSDSDIPKDTLSLHTPNLEYLEFGGHMPQLISVTKMPLVSRVDIGMSWRCGYNEDYKIGPSGLLGAAPNVNDLFLYGDTQLNLEAGLSRNESLFQQLINLKLSLATWFGSVLLPYFLRVSLKLRSISVHDGISGPGVRYFNGDMFDEHNRYYEDILDEHDWIPPNNVPECLISSLKEFEVVNFCGQSEKGIDMIKTF